MSEALEAVDEIENRGEKTNPRNLSNRLYTAKSIVSDMLQDIREAHNLSAEAELEDLVAKPKVVSKHISEVKEGDRITFDGFTYTAASDAYMTKTDNGKEWNVEVEGDGPESYIYATDLVGGMIDLVPEEKKRSLDSKIQSAETRAAEAVSATSLKEQSQEPEL